MRLFGRYVQIQTIPQKGIQLINAVIKILILCKSPVRVVKGYVFKKEIPSTIYLRNGFTIHLSSNENDLVTFVTIFCRMEYGTITKGQTVVDVGANIGLFTIYAAMHGAQKIVAIEPNAESFETLTKNIAANNLKNVVAVKKAVSSKSGEYLYIPKHSDPENISLKEMNTEVQSGYEQVETVSLPDLLRANNIHKDSLLKMDCEGAEYDILLPLTNDEMKPIQTVKMEYHADTQSLINHFCKNGFEITRLKPIITSKIKTGMLEAERV